MFENNTTMEMNEYWIDCGETAHQETKEGFYKAINAGFRGFILYPNGETYWIKSGEPEAYINPQGSGKVYERRKQNDSRRATRTYQQKSLGDDRKSL